MTSPAMQFAIERHGDQMYGDKPYQHHLHAVCTILRDFGYFGKWLDAGALHDVIEDTPTTIDEIMMKWDEWTAKVVWACTGVGVNRKERNASIYEKIAAFPAAAVVKMADRIANVENSTPGSGHAAMYIKEARAFYDAVGCHAPADMVMRLDRAYAVLEGAA